MPKRTIDPLGRNHQIERRPASRSQVDSVCNHVLKMEKGSFQRWPSSKHVYFDAYTLIFGFSAACDMLEKERDEK